MLSLWNNAIGDEGACALAIALREHHFLKELDLRANGIPGGPAHEHLERMPLRQVSLGGGWDPRARGA